METTLVAPHCAGTSRICGKIKKSNVLHYICHFTSDKNNFLHSWLFFSLTWAENEHWQPLVALRPLEAVKSFISCPCDTGKQPLIPKIVSDTGKMTNEWSKVLFLCIFCLSYWNRSNKRCSNKEKNNKQQKKQKRPTNFPSRFVAMPKPILQNIWSLLVRYIE